MSNNEVNLNNDVNPNFYMLVQCPGCDEEIHLRMVSLLDHNGLLVVPADMIEQTRVDCENCGGTAYYGELDCEFEGGEEDDAKSGEEEDGAA